MATFEEAQDAIAVFGWVQIEQTEAANRGKGNVPKTLRKREVKAVETCLALMLGRKPTAEEIQSTINRLS
jgi:hypothetical protein